MPPSGTPKVLKPLQLPVHTRFPLSGGYKFGALSPVNGDDHFPEIEYLALFIGKGNSKFLLAAPPWQRL